jgi:hypothetical protein
VDGELGSIDSKLAIKFAVSSLLILLVWVLMLSFSGMRRIDIENDRELLKDAGIGEARCDPDEAENMAKLSSE